MKLLCLIFACLVCMAVRAEITLVDDTGATVRLFRPASRIVSLAPHITETLFAAGAADKVVGVVEYSDYPEAAKKIPRIGGYSRLDLEAIAALKPDLAIGWFSGNSPAHIEKIRALGIPVFLVQPYGLEDIAANLERFGRLAGTEKSANAAAQSFRTRLAQLRARYAQRPKVSVFYQVWHRPLTTIGGRQIISEVIRLCGGENVFADLTPLAPQVSIEAVLSRDPEAIVASGMGEARPEWLDEWRKWPSLTAVVRNNLFFIPPDLIQRPTPRLLDGALLLCEQLERARTRK
ncbi:MAG: cobalamin-binding protein [Rhodocyclaceae bacterium]|nr:cobalamin-binding protein [Rhodocyclaceae bacterium]